jgi:Calcineurin-like phosphoesterase
MKSESVSRRPPQGHRHVGCDGRGRPVSRYPVRSTFVALISILISTACSAPIAPSGDQGAVLVGAGDIGECGSTGPAATAALLDGIEGTVFTTGDNAYSSGTAEEFANCYAPTWGRHRGRTRPSPGNHDYDTPNAAPYYSYFGDQAGPPGRGFYSYDVGPWHIVSLNSNVAAGPGSEQLAWLRSDLAQASRLCTLAYWHHPLFSSGTHGNDPSMRALWGVLYEARVEIVVNGHDHDYERFAPQSPNGQPDEHGIREFVVGTGGHSNLRAFSLIQPNSEMRAAGMWGVLKLTLLADRYQWEFVATLGSSFRDIGSGTCF